MTEYKISKHPEYVAHKATSLVWVCDQAAGEKHTSPNLWKRAQAQAVTT